MTSNFLLLIFAVAFMGCVLATPVVSRIATWAGAIDKPDQFRRIHKGAVPRMGGLALAFGLALCTTPVIVGGYLRDWPGFEAWWAKLWAVVAAGVIVLLVGAYDDSRGMSPKIKLLGQSLAVLVLFLGGIRIDGVALLGLSIPLSYPIPVELGSLVLNLDPVSFVVSLFWFLACMNIWNLIDGMDGLASGVGMIVSSTLMLVAIHQQNYGSAVLAAGLSGCLAGFLLYNWHPACIFLGDSGSLLIGLLIGVIGVQDSLKGTTTVSILFPILAMGLPVSDTAMAIFRRLGAESTAEFGGSSARSPHADRTGSRASQGCSHSLLLHRGPLRCRPDGRGLAQRIPCLASRAIGLHGVPSDTHKSEG